MGDKLRFGKSRLTRYSLQYSQAFTERTYQRYKITNLFSRCPPSCLALTLLLPPLPQSSRTLRRGTWWGSPPDLGMGQARCTVWSHSACPLWEGRDINFWWRSTSRAMKHSTPRMRLKFQNPASSFNKVSLYQVFQKRNGIFFFFTCEHISHGNGIPLGLLGSAFAGHLTGYRNRLCRKWALTIFLWQGQSPSKKEETLWGAEVSSCSKWEQRDPQQSCAEMRD